MISELKKTKTLCMELLRGRLLALWCALQAITEVKIKKAYLGMGKIKKLLGGRCN